MPYLPWAIAGLAMLLVVGSSLAWWMHRRNKQSQALTEWALTTRPLFNPDERLVFRLLTDALPHHVVMAKVPLVRFCRPADSSQVAYWHDLLGSIYVSFVVCAPNGRVLAALDVDSPRRSTSRRIAMIKHEVLRACRIRYVKCRADQLPNVSELQMLVPHQGIAGRAAVPDTVDSVHKVRATLAHTLRARGAGRPAGAWSDSAIGSDSFFSPDSRIDEPAGPDSAASVRSARAAKKSGARSGATPETMSQRLRLFFSPGSDLRPEDTVH